MNRPNARTRKQTDDRVTYAPTAAAELGPPSACRPVPVTYAHPRMMPDRGEPSGRSARPSRRPRTGLHSHLSTVVVACAGVFRTFQTVEMIWTFSASPGGGRDA
jgi:hypothetical protein